MCVVYGVYSAHPVSDPGGTTSYQVEEALHRLMSTTLQEGDPNLCQCLDGKIKLCGGLQVFSQQ